MKLLRIFACLCLSLFTCVSFAMVPPSYLSIKHWKSCVSSYMKRSAELVCLPDRKPLNCPRSSWRELKRDSSLSDCPRRHHHHHYDRDDNGIGSTVSPIGAEQPIGASAPQ